MKFFEKGTFYDLVSLVVPGALILTVCLFADSCFCCKILPTGADINWIVEVSLFGIVLLLGFVCKLIASVIWKEKRNDIEEINTEYRKYKKEKDSLPDDKTITELDTPEYFKRYYYVAKNTYNKHIPILESHIAFFQNWIVASGVSIVLIPLLYCCCCCPCKLLIIEMLLLISIFVAYIGMNNYIRKVYYLVFSDYEYLTDYENTKRKESRQEENTETKSDENK